MVSKKVQHFGVGPLEVFEKFSVGWVVAQAVIRWGGEMTIQ